MSPAERVNAPAFAPCAVIPIFNHKDTIAATVRSLRGHGVDVVVVDDGSNQATREVLDELARQTSGMRLIRLPENQGKGRALSAGLLAAREAGFTHAFQIAADGQQGVADVPLFLA